MPRDSLFITAAVQKPVSRHLAVLQRFLRTEGLRLDQEKGGFRVYLAKRLTNLCAVDVGHVMAADTRLGVGLKGFADQLWAQIGAADTDAHYIGERLAGVSGTTLVQNVVYQCFHAIESALYHGDHVLAVYHDGLVAGMAQGCMQGRAIFGNVDPLPLQQGLPPGFQVAAAGQSQQCLQHLIRKPVLGKIQ